MKVVFESSFARDLKRIRDRQVLRRVQEVIADLKNAHELGDLAELKKLQGHATFYRIRLGDYRIGIELAAGEVILVRILHRKDIYRYFP